MGEFNRAARNLFHLRAMDSRVAIAMWVLALLFSILGK